MSDWTGRNPEDKELERVQQEAAELLELEDVRPVLAQRLPQSDALPAAVVATLALVAFTCLSPAPWGIQLDP